MAYSTVWWLIAGAAVVLELLSGTVYLLLLGAGLVIGVVLAPLAAAAAIRISLS